MALSMWQLPKKDWPPLLAGRRTTLLHHGHRSRTQHNRAMWPPQWARRQSAQILVLAPLATPSLDESEPHRIVKAPTGAAAVEWARTTTVVQRMCTMICDEGLKNDKRKDKLKKRNGAESNLQRRKRNYDNWSGAPRSGNSGRQRRRTGARWTGAGDWRNCAIRIVSVFGTVQSHAHRQRPPPRRQRCLHQRQIAGRRSTAATHLARRIIRCMMSVVKTCHLELRLVKIYLLRHGVSCRRRL